MSLEQIRDHLKQTGALSQVAGLLNWDQEAVMPKGGAAQRAVQQGALAVVVHHRHGDPSMERKAIISADSKKVALVVMPLS